MKTKTIALTAAAVAALAGPAFAHHSFSMFDAAKEVTLNGTVKEFQWTNPHSWIQLTVKTPQGQVEEWAIEGMSPNNLARHGWNRKTIKAGDQVAMKIHPLKSGEKGGSFVSATYPDGHTLTNDNTGPAAPPAG